MVIGFGGLVISDQSRRILNKGKGGVVRWEEERTLGAKLGLGSSSALTLRSSPSLGTCPKPEEGSIIV